MKRIEKSELKGNKKNGFQPQGCQLKKNLRVRAKGKKSIAKSELNEYKHNKYNRRISKSRV